ncbi:MAG: flagellar basal body P-ring protein FlgI [Halanaerobiales bacterium]
MKINKHKLYRFIITLLVVLLMSSLACAATYNDPVVRIGDITRIKGVRNNQLYGFGLVIGLAGTGDTNRYAPTIQSHANMLTNMGIEVTPDQVNSRNVAAVMVTATLPPFAHNGDTIDVTISSLGDADSIQGGTLFMTSLNAANGDTYAVAQGPISTGGFNVQSGGGQSTEGHLTVAKIPNGAIVERELSFEMDNEELTFLLDQANFETARNIALAINAYFDVLHADEKIASAVDPGQIHVNVPTQYKNDVVDFVSKIHNLEVRPAVEAKVVIDETRGTIVMGHSVRISTVYVAHGNLTVRISTQENVSQPPSFSEGETEVTEETEIDVSQDDAHFTVLPSSSTVQDLVQALNAIGATPQDIIDILLSVKAQGALHAELILE